MTPKPPLNSRVREKNTGYQGVVTEYTERGFIYVYDDPKPAFVRANWGTMLSQEVYTDLDWADWHGWLEVIENDFSI